MNHLRLVQTPGKLPIARLDVSAWAVTLMPREPKPRGFDDRLREAALPLAGELSNDMRAAFLDLVRAPLIRRRAGYVATRGPSLCHTARAVESLMPIGLAYRDFSRPDTVRPTSAALHLAQTMRGQR